MRRGGRGRLSRRRGGAIEPEERQHIQNTIANRDVNLGRMLQLTCRNSGNCIALGHYNDSIKRYFDDFRNWSLVNASGVHRLGEDSANGVVIEIPFVKNNYTAYCALKCSVKADADNLFYEYYVGKYFINTYLKKLPFFVETYDCYTFNDEQAWKEVVGHATSSAAGTISDISSRITLQQTKETDFHLFGESCKQNKYICILIQHFDRFNTFYDMYHTQFQRIKYDMYSIWWQLYFGLSVLGKNYTHYDLHGNNVCLYKPFSGKRYVFMRYHTKSGAIVVFACEYIVKIIDYGRNYFNNGKVDTKMIVEKYVCPATECSTNCGQNYGYQSITACYLDIVKNPSMNKENILREYSWRNITEPNMSHDLLFLNTNGMFTQATNLKVIYENKYGTPQNDQHIPNKITNIFTVCRAIQPAMNPELPKWMNKYGNATWTAAATMDIYEDGRDYVYEILPENNTFDVKAEYARSLATF